MKTLLLLISIGSINSICAQQSSVHWETRVQQTQIGGAVGTPMLVTRMGNQQSLPIGERGSIFTLWGWKIKDGQVIYEEQIDSKQVGTYLPEAHIDISTGDPFADFDRSRVDRPFDVDINVEGLLPPNPEAGIPDASTRVMVRHYADLYTEGTFDGKSVESERLVSEEYISQSGITKKSFPSTNITAPDGKVAQRAGQERFVVYALADGDSPQRIIAQSVVQIYPYPSGEITGIDETRAYVGLPDFVAAANNVYPGSSTWLEIYFGDFESGKRGERFPATREMLDRFPANFVNLDFTDFVPRVQPYTSGRHTLVLRTSSPFLGESIEEGGIMLSNTPIQMGQTIQVNSSVTTME